MLHRWDSIAGLKNGSIPEVGRHQAISASDCSMPEELKISLLNNIVECWIGDKSGQWPSCGVDEQGRGALAGGMKITP